MIESKQSKNEKEKKRKQFCDQMIAQESVYIRNAYYSGMLDLYKLFVWYIVNYEIIIDRKRKKLMPKSTREAIKNARRGEKRLTKELLYSPIVVNKYKIDKDKRDVFTGKLKNKNLKSDLSPELSTRMIYEYANKSKIMDLFSPKELFCIYCMAYVDDETFFNAILDSDNVVQVIKRHITLNEDCINSRLVGFDAKKY